MANTTSDDHQAAALTAIAVRDPAFDVHAFLAEAAATYLDVHRAKAAGTPATVADKINPSVSAQLGLDQAHPAETESPSLGELRITEASTDQSYDTIVVRIPATVDGRSDVEDWCFQRPANATSKPGGTPRFCSNCGAPRTPTPAGTCKFCGVPLTAGDDWVVTRVAEIDEPTPGRGQTALQLGTAIAAMMEAAAAAQRSGAAPRFEQAPQTRKSSSAKGCGCLTLLGLIVLVPVVALALAAAQPSSTFHQRLEKVFPFVRRAYLTGQVTATGASNSTGQSGNFASSIVRCNKLYLKAQSLEFSANLSDGSRITVKVDSRVGDFGTTQYTSAQQVSVTPSIVTAAGVTQQWSPNATSHTNFVLTPTGGGQMGFQGYTAALTAAGAPTAPLTATITWTCADK